MPKKHFLIKSSKPHPGNRSKRSTRTSGSLPFHKNKPNIKLGEMKFIYKVHGRVPLLRPRRQGHSRGALG